MLILDVYSLFYPMYDLTVDYLFEKLSRIYMKLMHQSLHGKVVSLDRSEQIITKH